MYVDSGAYVACNSSLRARMTYLLARATVAAAGYKRPKLRALTSREAFGQYDYYSGIKTNTVGPGSNPIRAQKRPDIRITLRAG
jgi:hypothetical protein